MNVIRCYVCKKYMKKVKALYIGNGLYRHYGCHAGSKAWLKSEVGKNSEMRQFFEGGDNGNKSNDR